MGKTCGTHGDRRGGDVVVRSEGERERDRPLYRPRSTGENYTEMDLKGIGDAETGLIWLWILTFGGLL
jgi:hypothetical protein